MKYLIIFASLLFPIYASAQFERRPGSVPEPRFIVVDSHDNVFVTLKYGIAKITPDGTVIDLSKQGPDRGLDRDWRSLIIDSKDNLYAHEHGGTAIYKITVSADNVAKITHFAGQSGYKVLDGTYTSGGFNIIDLITIDRNDNIYVTNNFEYIKDTIGNNFVTDSYYFLDRNGPKPKYLKSSVPRFSIIRKVSGGRITTMKTPDGKYILPHDITAITTDNQGNIIYSSGGFARFIGKIDLTSGEISSIAGQPYKRQWCPVYTPGTAAQSEFVDPAAAIITNKMGEILFTDIRLHRIIKIASGKVTTLAGGNIIDPCSQNIGGRAQEGNKDGKALTALFNFPQGMAYDSKGNLYIADMSNHSIRKLSPEGMITTIVK